MVASPLVVGALWLAPWSAALLLAALGFAAAIEAARLAQNANLGTLRASVIIAAVLAAVIGLVALRALSPHGAGWLTLALIATWMGDAGAYFVGRRLGRHKLAPKTSPNKTVEGAIGGTLAAAGLAALLGGWLLPAVSTAAVVILTICANIIGQAGDLAESRLKRAAGVKDSGNLIPGYGGALDKIDSLVAATPVLLIGWLLLT